MRNKKGFLLAEETMKIIIAVISIGFLAFLLVSLYFALKSPGQNYAKDSLNHILSEVKAQRDQIQIYNPENWWIVTITSVDKSFLCICEKSDGIDCFSKGSCESSDLTVRDPIEITKPPLNLNVDYTSKIISEAQ